MTGTVETLHEGMVSRQASGRLTVEMRGQGFNEITDTVAAGLRALASATAS
jgi:hypothetical protein